MHSLAALARRSLGGLYEICTGRTEYNPLDEEHYRQRLLVTISAFWLLLVLVTTVSFPLFIDMRPAGALAANALFGAMATLVGACMLILRTTGNRILAVNVMLGLGLLAMVGTCYVFGGTQSPIYPLMLLSPALASIVGSARMAIGWGICTLAFWIIVLVLERHGVQFMQVIVPANYATVSVIGQTAAAIAVVSIIVIYAEMNKELRESLRVSNKELVQLSSSDQLTLLPNRRHYEEQFPLALQRAADRSHMVGILMIDLNGFKKINDTYGHGAGDKLLTEVAQRLRDNVRDTDLVARLGGDEFVVVLEGMKSPEQITRIAHKLSHAIEQPISVRQQPLRFSASCGVSIFPVDGRQQHELEEQADRAMYLAKQRGIGVALSSLEDMSQPIPVRPHLSQL
ncbi:MAG: GGDEF domain-containing protein [Halioglobus sp.]|nr:GGDEF domain-containing protein [Halioglobus sp.]